MAEVKPLKLRREFARARRARALVNPYARVLVDHQIFHLEHYFDYLVPEELSETAVIGALVEVEIGPAVVHGRVREHGCVVRFIDGVEFAEEGKVRIDHLKPRWQGVFQGKKTLGLSQFEAVGDKDFVTEMERRFGRSLPRGIGEIFCDPVEPDSVLNRLRLVRAERPAGGQNKRTFGCPAKPADRQLAGFGKDAVRPSGRGIVRADGVRLRGGGPRDRRGRLVL